MTQSTNIIAPDSQRAAIDNLIRRELKVGDPRDPAQLAQALMQRYQTDRRALAIEGEARGLPFLQTPLVRPVGEPVPAALDLDLEQSRRRVENDLQSLLTDSLTSTLRPELEGWQNAIHAAITEGVNAARQGMDPGRRDVAFGVRYQLGEYARLARLVGLFSPPLNAQYRSLATSLDDVASVLLVMLGDAMANLGLSGGRFLLNTSYSDLQARRDAVLSALRRIDGVATLAGGTTWPRGLRAHRQMNLLLEARGQGDLRSLLSEVELARIMDDMVQLASGGTPQGLRSIGSTTWSPLARMNRFVRAVASMVEPASHELAGLVEALRLFIEGFEPAGGFRLLRVARPALLSMTGGGLTDEQPADRRLMALTRLRPRLADLIDAWTECRCEVRFAKVQAVLDCVLFEMDRAIDAYANGSQELGLCEARAVSLHLLVAPLLHDEEKVNKKDIPIWGARVPDWVDALRNPSLADPSRPDTDGDDLRRVLTKVSGLVRPNNERDSCWAYRSKYDFETSWAENDDIAGDGAPAPRLAQLLFDELSNGQDSHEQAKPVVQQMALDSSRLATVMDALKVWQDAACELVAKALTSTAPKVDRDSQRGINVPPHFEESLSRLK